MDNLTTVSTMLRRPTLLTTTTLLITMLMIKFLTNLVSHRKYFRKLQAEGLPMPPHNIIFGHILVMIRVAQKLPKDAHFMHVPYCIQKSYDLGPDFYLDMWPLSSGILMSGSPETLHQVSVKYALPKNDVLKHFLQPLTDGLDIVSLNGSNWKKWRTIFKPGFSSNQLMKLVPTIVQNVETYCEQLDEHARKDQIFIMKKLTDNLTIDVIGEVTLGIKLNAQTMFNPIVHSLRTQIKWLTAGVGSDLFVHYNPMRPLIQWYHGAIVNKYVLRELDRSIDNWGSRSPDNANQTITDLALQAYAEMQSNESLAVQDPFFKKICSSQIKIFLFAGHDTTSSGICFALWLLSQNQDALKRLRREHDEVFGLDPSKAAKKIVSDPILLSKIHYTNAVIKESLRHFTPTTSTRAGQIGVSLSDSIGRIFPTDNMIVWCNQYSIHRDESRWSLPHSFIPERWLPDQADESLHPIKGMWRPFEHGPRSCLGQELAMLEMRIALVLVSRTYKFMPAYDEFDKTLSAKENILGTRAYQVDTMQPRGDLPVRVARLEDL